MPERRRRRLSSRLPVLVAMTALAVLLIGLAGYQYAKRQWLTSAGESLALAAADIADTLDRSLFERYGDVQMMTDAFAGQMHDPPTLSWYLGRMKDRHLVYRWLGVTDQNGRVVAATDPESLGEDWNSRTWFQAARDTWVVHVEGVQVSHEPDRHRGVTFASPIWDDQGRFRGVVATHIDIAEVQEVFVRTANMITGAGGSATTIEWQLLANDGTVITGSTAQDDGTVNVKQLGLLSALRSASAEPGYVEEEHQRRHVPVVTGYAHTRGVGTFTGLDWGILLRVDRADILVPLDVLAWKVGLAVLCIVLPMTGLFLRLTGRLQKAWASSEEQAQAVQVMLETTRELAAESDHEALLARLTDTACRITGATYAALGVFDEAGEQLTQFVTSGLDEATKKRIGAAPTGLGLLGHLAQEPGVLRLKDLTQHPASCGVPAHHPAMRSFLGTSIRARGQLYGRFYVAEKRGGGEFTEVDERALSALALQASGLIERSRLILQLQNANTQSHTLLEATSEGIYGIDSEGCCRFINQAGASLMGYRPDEVVGQDIHRLFHHSHADGSPYPVEACPILQTLRAGAVCRVEEDVFWRRDGSACQVDYAAAPLRQGEAITGAVVVFSDITSRKQAAQDLTHAHQFLDSIVEHLPNAVFVKDAQRLAFVRWNKAGEELLGYTKEDMIGKTDYDLFDKAAADEITAGDREALLSGRLLDIPEELMVTKDQSIRVLHTKKIPILDEDGRPQYLLGISEDVTARKQAEASLRWAKEAAEATSQAKSEFVANMSHEIRTPMNGVIGMAELLIETDLTGPQREYAETIQHSGEALLTIINSILDFSKMEAGKLHLNSIDFNLRTLLDEVLVLLAARAHAKGLELEGFVQADVPPILRSDPDRLRQILINLVGNAIKFTETGEVVVRVGLVGDAPGLPVVRFEVRDSGIGITPEDRARLFQPFTQVDGSSTRKYGGTGLGLAICRQLAELMGGEIGVESEPGRGSTFWVTVRSEQSAATPAAEPGPGVDLRGMRVCVVGTRATTRAILESYFQGWGVQSVSADGGLQALEVLRAAATRGEPFDLAMIGTQVSGMDGQELARAIKADAALAPVRSVLLTTVGRQDHADRAREVGCAAVLSSPIRQSQLYACLVEARVVPAGATSAPSQAAPVQQESLDTLSRPDDAPVRPGLRILLAEDNVINQKVAVHMLTKLACRVDVASNGVEALEALARGSYDVVLMDCQMPEMDGFEATRAIRNAERGTMNDEQGEGPQPSDIQHSALNLHRSRRVPIIAMTANALLGDRERCLEAGMDDYLPKPVTLAPLRAVLRRWGPGEAPAPSIPQAAGSGAVSPALSPGVQAGPPSAATEGTQETGPAVFNRAQALARMEGDAELLKSLAGLFVAAVPQELADIREAVARRDAAVLMQKAHKLQGAVLQFCAPDVLAAVRSMEALGRGGDLAGVETACADLEKNVMGLVEALKAVTEETTVCR